MTESIAARLGLADRELVALVGAGGKSTLLLSLGEELAAAGRRVILTTTTKLGSDQAALVPTVCRSAEAAVVAAALGKPGPVMVVTGGDDHKATGPSPEMVDRLYATVPVDYILVEADGARRRPCKAPAAHEPVIPAAATLVVVVIGADAVGGVIAEVCHRPELVAAVTGRGLGDRLDAAACATLLGHPAGGLRRVPPGARVAVTITKVGGVRLAAAADVANRLAGHPRIERVVTFPVPS